MVQTLETTSGRKWTENTENVAKRLNAQYAVAEKEGWARRDCAAEFCTQLSFYLPSIVLCLCLSHYAKASGLELTTVGPWG